MGILNVTPDSFSDGGRYNVLDRALKKAEEMVCDGASIIDVGGESTRPGAVPVSLQEEMDRVLPVVEGLVREAGASISVDTSTPEVMIESASLGAHLINDVRALSRDGALTAASGLGVPICLMHMQGTPETMQNSPTYAGVVGVVKDYLLDRVNVAIGAGISRDRLLIDPGFGFGKTLAHNLAMLKFLKEFMSIGCPVLVGVSRKAMIGNVVGRPSGQRVHGSVGAAVIAAMNGASILRVHDVRETVDALALVSAINRID